jgi:predicted ArsR family transcriptional regulator
VSLAWVRDNTGPRLCRGKELGHTDVVKNVSRPTTQQTSPQAGASAAAVSHSERDTRARVARLVLEQGPITASGLGQRVGLTPAAIRRHLDALLAEGLIEVRRARPQAQRGRGRPAKLFAITDAGRNAFVHAYDDLATSALRFLAETAGERAVGEFARRQIADLERRLQSAVHDVPPHQRVRVLAEALSGDGYAASASNAPRSGGGEQLCQHHCPVAHVAAEFPQLCEAETEAFGRLLGTPVQRLATIAHGDGVCTTHVSPRALTEGTTDDQTSANEESGRISL